MPLDLESQRVISLQELDTINSCTKFLGANQKSTLKHNTNDWVLESLLFSDSHSDFASSLDLRKPATEMTDDKSKEMLQRFKLQLVDIVGRHMHPGSGADQLSGEDPD